MDEEETFDQPMKDGVDCEFTTEEWNFCSNLKNRGECHKSNNCYAFCNSCGPL